MKNIRKIKKNKTREGQRRSASDPCEFVARLQTLVVRRLDKTIHWIDRHPVDLAVSFVLMNLNV